LNVKVIVWILCSTP